MKVAVLGRSGFLLRAAKSLHEEGHDIVIIGTARSESHYDANENDFETFSREISAEFFVDGNLNTEKRVAQLRGSGAEVAVSVNWPNILGGDICNAFKYGILNAHAGDLPRYRGNACPNWAIINGEQHVGLCIHQMEPGELDSGPVLVRERLALTSETYIGDVYRWMNERIPKMYCRALRDIVNGTTRPQTQTNEPELTLRCYPRRPEDSRIIWMDSATQIQRLVRATSRPLSGAFCFLEGKAKLIVWKAKVVQPAWNFLALPGQVLYSDCGDPVVACGKSALRLQEVSMSGITDAKAKEEVLRSLRNRLT